MCAARFAIFTSAQVLEPCASARVFFFFFFIFFFSVRKGDDSASRASPSFLFEVHRQNIVLASRAVVERKPVFVIRRQVSIETATLFCVASVEDTLNWRHGSRDEVGAR